MFCSVNPLFGACACCTVQGHAGVPEIATRSAMRVLASPAHALHSSLVGGVSVAKATVVQSPIGVLGYCVLSAVRVYSLVPRPLPT